MKTKLERMESLYWRIANANRLKNRALRMADKYDRKILSLEKTLFKLSTDFKVNDVKP